MKRGIRSAKVEGGGGGGVVGEGWGVKREKTASILLSTSRVRRIFDSGYIQAANCLQFS